LGAGDGSSAGGESARRLLRSLLPIVSVVPTEGVSLIDLVLDSSPAQKPKGKTLVNTNIWKHGWMRRGHSWALVSTSSKCVYSLICSCDSPEKVAIAGACFATALWPRVARTDIMRQGKVAVDGGLGGVECMNDTRRQALDECPKR